MPKYNTVCGCWEWKDTYPKTMVHHKRVITVNCTACILIRFQEGAEHE